MHGISSLDLHMWCVSGPSLNSNVSSHRILHRRWGGFAKLQIARFAVSATGIWGPTLNIRSYSPNTCFIHRAMKDERGLYQDFAVDPSEQGLALWGVLGIDSDDDSILNPLTLRGS